MLVYSMNFCVDHCSISMSISFDFFVSNSTSKISFEMLGRIFFRAGHRACPGAHFDLNLSVFKLGGNFVQNFVQPF